jgi:hypothetical protein
MQAWIWLNPAPKDSGPPRVISRIVFQTASFGCTARVDVNHVCVLPDCRLESVIVAGDVGLAATGRELFH